MQQRIGPGGDLALIGLSKTAISAMETVIPGANNSIAMAAVMRLSMLTSVMVTKVQTARSKRPLHFTQLLLH